MWPLFFQNFMLIMKCLVCPGSWPLNADICNFKVTLNQAGEREIIEAILGGRMEVGSDMK